MNPVDAAWKDMKMGWGEEEENWTWILARGLAGEKRMAVVAVAEGSVVPQKKTQWPIIHPGTQFGTPNQQREPRGGVLFSPTTIRLSIVRALKTLKISSAVKTQCNYDRQESH